MLAKNRGLLPRWYAHPDWRNPFYERLALAAKPGARILDVGSGSSPAIPPDVRPEHCTYIGLDIDADELRAAPTGSYDSVVLTDVCKRDKDLLEAFDLVVSWQALEHVEDLELALDNIHAYLKEGGEFVALLSGRYAAFAVLNRMLPAKASQLVLKRVMKDRDPNTIFKAYYDRCTATDLERLLRRWAWSNVEPLFRGADYFSFNRILLNLYIHYELIARKQGWTRLATHYFVAAVK
jgi:SAM-dependent methyltransferase